MIAEKNYRLLFKGTIIVKAIDSVFEIILGILLSVFGYNALQKFIMGFLGDELSETPRDLFWTYAVKIFHGLLTHSAVFWATLLLLHGILKIILLIALWRQKFQVYPVAGILFALFAIYELFEVLANPTILLAGAAFFDAILVILIFHEYRYQKRLRSFKQSS